MSKVLIITGGMTPQVVTETVYALATRQPDPMIPTKIICAVTGGAAERFGAPLEEALARLKRQLDINADWEAQSADWRVAETGLFLAVPRGEDGTAIDDIRTERDAILFGDLVSEIVQRETLAPEARVHLSLAGGRKTMSFHGGAAMVLFGRAKDELSHVLVHPPEFEQCREFWFPTAHSAPLKDRAGTPLDAKDARIELAPIPFIRIRDYLPAFAGRRMSYNDYVSQINAMLGRAPLFLELMPGERRVHIGSLAEFTLPPTLFALYQLMAEWKHGDLPGASAEGIGPQYSGWLTAEMFERPEDYAPNPMQRFLDIYAALPGSHDDMQRSMFPEPRDDDQRKSNSKTISEAKSRLGMVLQGLLHHPDLMDRFGAPLKPVEVGRRRVVYGLRLTPDEIRIHPA
ncbi:MAG: CRISPR-associated ring nuclease Csm6 [Stellaceae bacterium]